MTSRIVGGFMKAPYSRLTGLFVSRTYPAISSTYPFPLLQVNHPTLHQPVEYPVQLPRIGEVGHHVAISLVDRDRPPSLDIGEEVLHLESILGLPDPGEYFLHVQLHRDEHTLGKGQIGLRDG